MRIQNRFIAVFFSACFLAFSAFLQADEPTAKTPSTSKTAKPNIILILADDLGYECVGANGGKSYRTPALDRMAREGTRFEHCYAQPNCTPTRVQLMTGLSNVRNYVDFGTLEKSQTTFGHVLRQAGYATCIAGKWQLGSRDASLPKHFGFAEHCLWAHMGRGERYANPSLSVNGAYQTFPSQYGPDVCHKFVLDFIRRTQNQPFFVYYPMILTHGPYSPTPHSSDYGKDPKKGREAQQKYFSDMVAYMDHLIGNLSAELESLGLRKNTLILFTGDNGTGRGAVTELEDGSEQAGEKGSTTRAGMHVPLIASWPSKITTGFVSRDLVDMTDFLPTFCDAAGIDKPRQIPLDGRSFLPILRGEQATPREWIYSYWVPLRANQTAHLGKRGAVEQVFDREFKLYSTGEFFDLARDPEERAAIPIANLTGGAAAAASSFEKVLRQFEDARPPHLNAPRDPRDKKGKKRK